MKNKSELNAALHDFFVANGAKGGQSRSKKKMAAMAANLAKARSLRWKKKRAAA